MNKLIQIVPCLILLSGCGAANTLDVGDEKTQRGQLLSDYAASWDGYAEATAFPGDGTDRIRLVLDENGVGTIRFGEEALFGPAIDADALYPPTHPQSGDISKAFDSYLAGLRSGFDYEISSASIVGGRLRVEFDANQIMASFCSLQMASPLPGWTCGQSGWMGDGNAEDCSYNADPADPSAYTSISCHRAAQCSECTCDETECSATPSLAPVELDARLSDDGTELMGTLLLPEDLGGRVTLRMTL